MTGDIWWYRRDPCSRRPVAWQVKGVYFVLLADRTKRSCFRTTGYFMPDQAVAAQTEKQHTGFSHLPSAWGHVHG
jgi:hypothetical protein